MKVLVTGGGGFVMANFLRHWLEATPDNSAVSVDAAPLDAAASRFLAPVRDRLQFVEGDVASASLWESLPRDFDFVVHGAAVTPHAYVDTAGFERQPERESPVRIIETNVLGTARALAWTGGLENLRRFVYVSTGSVYAEEVAEQRTRPFPLPEEGYVGPRGLYDITKYSGELLTRRFAELFDLSAVSVRLSNVFGPLDRQTPFRNVRNPVNIIAHAAAEGRSVAAANLDVPGDYVYVGDVADALCRILRAPRHRLAHAVYNIAYGRPALVRDLLDLARQIVPGLHGGISGGGAADIRLDMDRGTGRWGAYDISRASADFGWRPRPLREAILTYVVWLRQETSA
jgi:UDP-glucose 4-epimerase